MSRRASWQRFGMWGANLVGSSIVLLSTACSDSERNRHEDVGEAQVELTNTPSDVRCVRLTVDGPSRTDVRKFPVTTGQRSVFRLEGLPVGKDTFTAHAFAATCENLNAGADPTWYSEPVVANIKAAALTHVAIKMIHNGKASVGIDFGDGNGPTGPTDPPPDGGVHSSEEPFVTPLGCPVKQAAILTTGDSPNLKPDGSRYRMVGAPDGLGAFDNGDGTFTLLANHGLGVNSGIVRAHGARGAFISKWRIRKADLAVLEGSDLVQRVAEFNPDTGAHGEPSTGVAFGRFSSADLPKAPALYDAASDLGYDGNLLFNGEQVGDEGRAWVHGMDGVSFEFARMGRANWENLVANPGTGKRTVVLGTDGSAGGQLYVYLGEKTNKGSPAERAGLTNGSLFGVRVAGVALEDAGVGIPDGSFALASLGNAEGRGGAALHEESVKAGVTGFQVPADGAWDPNSPSDFYFVTKAAFELPSRLYRLRFFDAANPAQGGVIEMLLDGSEGQRMLDGVALDQKGHVYLQEDPGPSDHLARIWRYDIASDQLSEVSRHDPSFFSPGSATFLTNDEESSGIFDASDILGPSRFILTSQVHVALRDAELVEGGQLSLLFDNDGLGNVMAALATLMVECTGTIGPDSFVLRQGVLGLPDGFECTNPEARELDKAGSIRAYLSLQLPRRDGHFVMQNAAECIGGRWARWREAFARTGIKQEQCPVWERIGIRRSSGDDKKAEFAKATLRAATQDTPEGDVGISREPPDLELFKVFRDFDTAFQQAAPDHSCTRRGSGACAALCAGAFPGFVIQTDGPRVEIDAMEWLEDDVFVSNDDPYLEFGYYHPTWAYGETVGHRNRANSCGAVTVLKSQCRETISEPPVGKQAAGQRRSCSANNGVADNDNCASEICSVPTGGVNFQNVRFRLDCLDPMELFDPAKDPVAWQNNWDTCVAACFLGP
jgi:hypothetical protein